MLILPIEASALTTTDAELPLRLLEAAARQRGREVVRAELNRVRHQGLLSDEQLAVIETAALAMAERLLWAPMRVLGEDPAPPRSGADCLRVGRALGLDAGRLGRR